MKTRALSVLFSLLFAACGAAPSRTPPGPHAEPAPPGSEPDGDAETPRDDTGAPAGDTPAPGIEVPPASFGLVLPLGGRSRLLGQQLAGAAQAMFVGDEEDRPAEAPSLRVLDGGDADSARHAIATLAEDEQAFCAVGLFDQTVAEAAADAAAAHQLPLIMLTLSDAPVKRAGALWRALHTPALVARTVSDAGLARGGREAAILSPRNGYGRALAAAFRRSWEAAGGSIAYEADWDPGSPAWAKVARAARAASFDTLFIADGPVGAALLSSHLAAEDLWSRGRQPRFARDKKVREVQVLGTPEWYEARLLSQAGRYLEGALVPVPFAVEMPAGAEFASRLRAVADREPTSFDALLADGLAACQQAHARLAAGAEDVADAFAGVRVTGVSAGLRLDQPEALDRLLLLEVKNGVFVPAE
jgi:ABC-type branched-subunit amino acid transport system substrate-binding protein